MFELTPDKKLKNGALLLHKTKTDEGFVVLAMTTINFVTWCMDERGDTFFGHYFNIEDGDAVERAAADYKMRQERGY